VKINACSLFIYYQDYVSDLVTCHRPEAIRICELILRSDSSQPNFKSTISAIQSASIVVVPTTGIINLPSTSNIRAFMAPYGGNKCEFYSHGFSLKANRSERFPGSSVRLQPSSLRILARSHSFRKGADVLLQALCLLDKMLQQNAFGFNIEVHICGAIQEPYIYSEYLKATSHLSQSGCIHLHCQQYGRRAFSRLLANSHLFIMPSRLESSSLAIQVELGGVEMTTRVLDLSAQGTAASYVTILLAAGSASASVSASTDYFSASTESIVSYDV
jgi:glycosyltransferase involved in cell wall biosynthesis